MLTKQEEKELIRLLGKMEFPVSQELFFAWSKSSTTVSADVILMRKSAIGHEVFLTYRDDLFYKGWHVPGSVRLPPEAWEDALKRVLTDELGLPASTKVEFFKWIDHQNGTGIGQSPRGSVISIYSICMNSEGVVENEKARFFRVSDLPTDIIPIHVPIIQEVVRKFIS